MRSFSVLLLSSLLFLGCPGGKESSGRLHYAEGGATAEFVLGDRRVTIPEEDVLLDKMITVPVQDESGKRHAYRINPTKSRIVYVVGGGIFVGPTASNPVDFKAAPDLEAAYGALFQHAGSRRTDLVREVGKEKGDSGIARLLSAGAHVDDPAWEEALAKLPGPQQEEVKNGLAKALEPGGDPAMLRRAVRHLPLAVNSRGKVLSQRVKELTGKLDTGDVARPLAVIVRAVAKHDPPEGGVLGCDVLKKKPSDDVLREAALVAIANAGASCEGMEEALGKDPCRPFFRCGAEGPLSGLETSKQDEALCTKAEVQKTFAKELARTADDVLAAARGTRGELFAYAILVRDEKLPASFLAAHERRRYLLIQPTEPPCDQVEAGKACHCEEAAVRDFACRKESGSVHMSTCKFTIDDEKKKITNVASMLGQ